MPNPDSGTPVEPTPETNALALLQAVLRRARTRIEGSATLKLPAIPALVEYYLRMIKSQWAGLGRPFTQEQLDALQRELQTQARDAFAASPSSTLTVTSVAEPLPKMGISWSIECQTSTFEQKYDEWTRVCKPPLFGALADAKVMEIAQTLSVIGKGAVLDVGAGTGRNTLPLARLGLQTDAVEITPAFAEILREEASKEQLNIRVFEGDILDQAMPLPANHYSLVVLAEVVTHFRSVDELRRLLVLVEKVLVSGGTLLLSAFIARGGYQPDELTRQVSQLTWSSLFTADELREAASGLSLELVSSEPTCEYEKSRQPSKQWPPTPWFESWSAGTGLFDLPTMKCPMELRWLTYRKAQ
ncbi:MAG TPA: class I SAM-dependent methyltransferase [Polyangiaceae bacterium]|nr:class I SAM-dependent methyltransferase [Polyangiaceae bacterium]